LPKYKIHYAILSMTIMLRIANVIFQFYNDIFKNDYMLARYSFKLSPIIYKHIIIITTNKQ